MPKTKKKRKSGTSFNYYYYFMKKTFHILYFFIRNWIVREEHLFTKRKKKYLFYDLLMDCHPLTNITYPMKCKRITFAMFHIAVTLTHFSSHSFYFCLSCQPNQSIFFFSTSFNPCPLSFSSFSFCFFSVVERCYLDSCLFVFFQLLKTSSWSLNRKKKRRIYHHVILPWKGPRVKVPH